VPIFIHTFRINVHLLQFTENINVKKNLSGNPFISYRSRISPRQCRTPMAPSKVKYPEKGATDKGIFLGFLCPGSDSDMKISAGMFYLL
jgi:hypothetical protein